MKDKGIIRLFTNPFSKIAGWQALLPGLITLFLTTYIGWKNGIVFDNLVGVHFFQTSLKNAFLVQGIDWLLLSVILWLAGLIFSRSSIRLIDVLGTMAMAEIPFLLVALMGFLPVVRKGKDALITLMTTFEMDPSGVAGLCLFAFMGLLVAIWYVVLVYNGYKVSCNVDQPKRVLVFIGSFVITLIISFVLSFMLLYNGMNEGIESLQTEETVTVASGFQEINTISVQIATDIQAEDFSHPITYFDERMKAALSPEDFKKAVDPFGKLVKIDTADVKNLTKGSIRIVLVPCTFEKAKLNLQLAFDGSDKVCGLYFNPDLSGPLKK